MPKEFGKRGRKEVAESASRHRPAVAVDNAAPEPRNRYGFTGIALVAAAIAVTAGIAVATGAGSAFSFSRSEPTKLESHVAFIGKLREQRMKDLGGDPQPLSGIFTQVAFTSTVTDFMMHAGPDKVLPASIKTALDAMTRDARESVPQVRANFGASATQSASGPGALSEQIDNMRRLMRDAAGLCSLANIEWLISDYRDYAQARDRAVGLKLVVHGETSARDEAANWRSVDGELSGRLRELARGGRLALPAPLRRAAAPILWEIREIVPEQDRCPDLHASSDAPVFRRPPGSTGFSR